MNDHNQDHWKHKIGLWAGVAIVIGSVVGSGVFVSASSMARAIPDRGWFLGIWVLAAAVTVLGALTQSELAARIPKSGGPYQYLRHAYGDVFGFLYGWANYTVIGSGAVAAISFVCASYLSEVLHLPPTLPEWATWGIPIPVLGSIYPFADFQIKLLAVFFIFSLTILNVRGIHWSAMFQSVASTAKIIAIFSVIAGIFLLAPDEWPQASSTAISSMNTDQFLLALTVALAGAFWAYDGWGTISYLSDEVKNPSKTVPLAILIGTALIVVLYLSINLSYIRVLSMEEIAGASGGRVASIAMGKVLGIGGAALVSILIATSTFDCTNATITANARVICTMARDKAFWKVAGKIHKKFSSPHAALWMQAVWASILLLSGSFEILTSMYVFVNWLTYGLLGVALFRVRFQQKHLPSPTFTTPLYPWIPLAFVGFACFYTVFALYVDVHSYVTGEQTFLKSLAGLVLMLSGLPMYYFWKWRDKITSA